MNKLILVFSGLSLFYGLVYFSEYSWWVLFAAPLQAAIILVYLAFAPRLHRWVFGDKFYKIDVNGDEK